ncbi:Acetyltransferase (GNAT) domain-containing protein [Aromatoleum bremense]|uniref:GNAT family N-acetyltransferase n=2 Tax=Aromatoleum bremense TaxID=76115 RepID=A0ABX1NVD6_9RHOO|nr:GNAT family N-acetyltransferase [Aromatoleum bremense]QTQ33736.1 Acetyltransferase (GNAT) domain-containing protein [Aromatoleum bremense]
MKANRYMPNTSPFLVPDRIESPRLVLRTFRPDDWPFLHEHYSDPESTRFTFRRALSEGDSWYAMANMVGHWHLRGYGPYAVEEKATGNVLGTVGLWYPKDWPEPEIKWALTRRYWGKGYASEAARTVQAMAKEHLPDVSLISFIHAENAASIALALAVGATFEKEMPFRGATWHIYRHAR